MAINKNHEFEDLGTAKCAIVEKNASAERVAFLKKLLEFNKYEVVVVESPAPKAAPSAPSPSSVEGELKTEEGTIVSLAYWQQKEKVSNDEIPYFEK